MWTSQVRWVKLLYKDYRLVVLLFCFIYYKYIIMQLKTTWWKTYDLELVKNNYLNNNRTYLGLVDIEDGEPFADLSENHPEISDMWIYETLPGHEAIIIDNDFINCFNSEREAKIWIKDNISECVITWDMFWLPCFYIKLNK